MDKNNLENLTLNQSLLESIANGSFTMERLTNKINDLMKKEHFEQAINLLNEYKKNAHLNTQKDSLKLHNLYLDIFLVTEDFKSLLNVLKSREKYLLDNKDFLYQQFYLAICYEGLEEIEKAIDTLESIPENISSKNLTNKYLKLVLLYLSINQFKKARAAYKLALTFDRDKNNDMFLLVESDLAYHQENYQEALNLYEDFFIQTKRKYAYLNRFIKINMQLNQLDEAYSFYEAYKEKLKQHVSLNNKISFFKAALPLLSQVNQSQYQEANNYLSDLISQKPIEIDDFNDYNFLLKNVKRNKIYYKSREIIRDLFIDLAETNRFEKLCYLKIVDGKTHLLHFNKKLLLEKTIEETYKIFTDIKNNQFLKTYKKIDIEDFIFLTEDTDYIFIEKIKENEYIMTYVHHNNFTLAKKLTILASHILKNNLNDFSIKSDQNNYIKNSKKLLNESSFGLLKISQNYLYFLNDYAKTLFAETSDFIKFADFQKQLTDNIYLDELMNKKEMVIEYKNQNIQINIVKDEYDLFLLTKAYKADIQTLSLTSLKPNPQESILLVSINNDLEYINKYDYHNYLTLKKHLLEFLKKQSHRHLKNIIESNEDLIYLHLDTIDKRVAQRISKQTVEAFPMLDLSVIYTKLNKTKNELKTYLNHLLAFSQENESIILSDKAYKLEKEKDHFYLEIVKKFIREKQIDLKYQFVKNWETEKLSFFDIEVNEIDLIKDKQRLNKVILKNDLGVLYDRLIVNQLINDLKGSEIKTKLIVAITKTSLTSKKALNYLLKRLELIKSNLIVFKLSFGDYLFFDEDIKSYLKTKGIQLCFYDVFKDLKINQIDVLNDADYLIINPKEYNHKLIKSLNELRLESNKQMIYNHQKESLIKSDLKNKRIHYIKGSFAGEVKDKSVFKKEK